MCQHVLLVNLVILLMLHLWIVFLVMLIFLGVNFVRILLFVCNVLMDSILLGMHVWLV